MARTNIGEQGGFLDDRQFVDALKVMYFMGAFFGAMGYLEAVDGALPKLMDKVTALFMIPGVAGKGAKAAADEAVRTWTENEKLNETIRNLPLPPAWETAVDVLNLEPEQKEKIAEGVENVATGQVPALGTAALLLEEYRTLKAKYDNMSRFNPFKIVLSRQLTNLRAMLRQMGVKI